MNTPQQFLSDYQDILSEDTTSFEKLKIATKRLNAYFEKAKEKNPEKTYKVVASPIMGVEGNRDISDREAYDTFVSHRIRTSDYLANKDSVFFNKLTFTDMLIKDFTNAFELDKKLLARLVCVDRLMNDKEYCIDDLYCQSTGRLLTELDQSCNDWKFWTILMDRRVRNAASHIDFRYDERDAMFKGKELLKKYKGKKINKAVTFSISPEEFLYETLPNAINASQSYWAAGTLLCLAPYPEYHKQALDILD